MGEILAEPLNSVNHATALRYQNNKIIFSFLRIRAIMRLPMILATLGQMGFRVPLTPFFLFILFTLLMGAWGVFSWIVRYHWKSYGTSKLDVMTMSLVYFVGSGILLAGMALFASLYNFSA
jgi:hypothetical protein